MSTIPEDDLLHSNIPFANKPTANIMYVLLQICTEQLEIGVNAIAEGISNSEDRDTRRELKVKERALNSYRAELANRIEDHAIALDHLTALQKRVKAVQKEKLKLREEILAIKQEREDVALRMDAVRLSHEKDQKMVMHQLGLSKAMYDVDLAVEAGYNAPELTPAERKKASLNNLELLICQVVDEVSSRSKSGGALKQIREFNAFLERTAAALEKR